VPRGVRTDSRADTVVAVACVVLSLVLLILPDAPRERISGAIRGNLVGPLAMLQQRAALARRSFVTNDSVVQALDSVLLRSQRLDAIAAENDQLRRALGLGRALRWGFVPAEVLVGRGAGDDHTVVLSAGSQSGVEGLSAVVSADGIVGIVSQVEARTSVAITWPHPEFRASATSADGNAFGIVTAHQGSGADRFLLELHGVPFRAQLRVGTPMVTSGLGGVFPRGVLIGTIVEELEGATGWSRSYLMRPAVRPSDATQVMILLPERNAEGVESVWAPGVNRFLQRVMTVGDSLETHQRDSTAAAARERLTDSIRGRLADSLRQHLIDSLGAAIRDSLRGAPQGTRP
jgi:rod shape-determining protein MreC